MSDVTPTRAEGAVPAVLVVGALPSLTSPAASLLVELGLAPPLDSDAATMPPRVTSAPGAAGSGAAGRLGSFESRSLAELEDRVLSRLGGKPDLPPFLETGIEPFAILEELSTEARSTFEAAFGLGIESTRSEPDRVGAVVFESTRIGLLLPFWRRVLRRPLAAVLVASSPSDLAADLAEGTGRSIVHGLALFERHLRSALSGLSGLAVLVVDAHDLETDAESFVSAARQLLKSVGLERDEAQTSSKCHPLEALPDVAVRRPLGPSGSSAPGRRSFEGEGPSRNQPEVPVLASQQVLYDLFLELSGIHPFFDAGELGPEGPWTTSELGLLRDLEHTFSALRWATRQIEPLLHMPPAAPGPTSRASRDALREDLRSRAEGDEQQKNLPYPLNASEDRRAYHRWLHERHLPTRVGAVEPGPRSRRDRRRKIRSPLVSVLVPVWQTPLWALDRCVSSVFEQSVRDFELCLCDDGSGDAELSAYLRSIHRQDRRVRVTALAASGGISAATNAALGISRGQFVAFLDHDDELAPHALETVAKAIETFPDVDMLYSDEDKIDASGERFDPLFKPEWSPDLLLSFAYTGHLTVIRKSLVLELGGLRSEYDGSQDYDLSIRASERARRIVHLPEVLYHWRTLPGSAASDSPSMIAKPWAYVAGLHAIEDALRRRGEEGEVTAEPAFPGRYHVRRAVKGRPLVSIIIPFRDEPSLLATCCTSLRADPGYDNLELVLVDNGSELPETAALLDELRRTPGTRVLESPGPFNWAAINNAAAQAASGDVLLFSNNDIEARAPRWLAAMLGHAQRAEVGAVGARLLYPDGAIQHAGVVVGLGGIAGHVLRGLPGHYPGYNSMAIQTRDCSVVTGACMMTRREVFESVGGFDEQLPVAFNDVDYCLKLRERGYLVVYTPLAELVHHESRSRGHTDDLAESSLILRRWGDVIVTGDPYLNVHLSHWFYWCPLSTTQENDRWKSYLETSVLTPESSSST